MDLVFREGRLMEVTMNGTHDCPKCQDAIARLREEIIQIKVNIGLLPPGAPLAPPVVSGDEYTRSAPPGTPAPEWPTLTIPVWTAKEITAIRQMWPSRIGIL